MLSLTMVMFEVDMGTMACGSAASTTAQWYGLMPRSDPGFQLNFQISAIVCGGKGMVIDCSAHQNHMNVVK